MVISIPCVQNPQLRPMPSDNWPQHILELYYLLTFYGEESDLEPQRLMGSVLSLLYANPVLKKDDIRRAINNMPYVDQVDFPKHIEDIKLLKLNPSFEELSGLWSTFFQIPYALSTTYRASPVIIDIDKDFTAKKIIEQ
jgi:hypothetical protein